MDIPTIICIALPLATGMVVMLNFWKGRTKMNFKELVSYYLGSEASTDEIITACLS